MLLRAMLFFGSIIIPCYCMLHACISPLGLGGGWRPESPRVRMACALCGGASDDRSPSGRVSAAGAGQTAGLHAGGSHGQVRGEIGSSAHCISSILLEYISHVKPLSTKNPPSSITRSFTEY